MTVRKILSLPLLLVLPALIAGYSGVAPQERAVVDSAQTLALTQAVPADPLITMGRLPNGLRYYIRANKTPLNRAELQARRQRGLGARG